MHGPSKSFGRYYEEALLMDLERHGVDVAVIVPGFVETDLTKEVTDVQKLSLK